MSTGCPLLRYSPQLSACLPNTTTSMKQGSSFHSSPCFIRLVTASPRVATGVPDRRYSTSGSRVKFPRSTTLFKLAITGPPHPHRHPAAGALPPHLPPRGPPALALPLVPHADE